MSASGPDRHWMGRALRLAALAAGHTSPNPLVGAVVLNAAGELVGEGYHRRAGEAHAEALALARAGAEARGGCLYVTLEPCCHQGRTPPAARRCWPPACAGWWWPWQTQTRGWRARAWPGYARRGWR